MMELLRLILLRCSTALVILKKMTKVRLARADFVFAEPRLISPYFPNFTGIRLSISVADGSEPIPGGTVVRDHARIAFYSKMIEPQVASPPLECHLEKLAVSPDSA